MTLQQLKYIITIAECGSITSAAGKLLVAQPVFPNQCQSLKRKWALRYFIVIIEECIYPRTAQISVICKTGYGTGGAFRTAV